MYHRPICLFLGTFAFVQKGFDETVLTDDFASTLCKPDSRRRRSHIAEQHRIACGYLICVLDVIASKGLFDGLIIMMAAERSLFEKFELKTVNCILNARVCLCCVKHAGPGVALFTRHMRQIL